MNKQRFCCYLGSPKGSYRECQQLAEWIIVHGPSPDDVTEACTKHVGRLLTDAKEHRVYQIEAADAF